MQIKMSFLLSFVISSWNLLTMRYLMMKFYSWKGHYIAANNDLSWPNAFTFRSSFRDKFWVHITNKLTIRSPAPRVHCSGPHPSLFSVIISTFEFILWWVMKLNATVNMSKSAISTFILIINLYHEVFICNISQAWTSLEVLTSLKAAN